MTTETTGLEAVADCLARARRTGAKIPVPAFELSGPGDAYRIQDAVARELGPVAGWKVGAKSPGAEPRCAPLLSGTVRAVEPRATVPVGTPAGVEVELAFRLGAEVRAGSDAIDDAAVLAMIDSAHLAVELCAARWTQGFDAPPLWSLADNQMNEALLVGPRIEHWREISFSDLRARLFVDGECAVDMTGGHQAGDPLALLGWLVRHCVRTRGGLASGAIITTGTWTGMHFVRPAATIEAELIGFGGMTFGLTPPLL